MIDKELKKHIITDDEWNDLAIIESFLKNFKEITVMISSSSYPTLSTVIPLYNFLLDHTENFIINNDRSSFIYKAATKCHDKLLEYYNKTNDICIVVTILDPRLKMEYYENEEIWNKDQKNEIYTRLVFYCFINILSYNYNL